MKKILLFAMKLFAVISPVFMAILIIFLSFITALLDYNFNSFRTGDAINDGAIDILLIMVYTIVTFCIGIYLLQIVTDTGIKNQSKELLDAEIQGGERASKAYAFGFALWALLWLIFSDDLRGEQFTYIFTVLFSATMYSINLKKKLLDVAVNEKRLASDNETPEA